MTDERHIDGQRKAVNRIVVLFVGLCAFMWLATLLDVTLGMEWEWDRQILWLAPCMILFAAVVRLCAMAVFKLVRRNP